MAPHSVRNITVVTGTRADYGILRPVLRAIADHPDLNLTVLVTAMHLLRSFGYTAREVLEDGWPLGGKVRLQTDNDDPAVQSEGLGRAISAMTRCFTRNRTDIVLVLGDRLEMFAAAAAAVASGRFLAHIHGGDVAPGVHDDAYRHAISKLAHIHFAATAGAARRLIRMGERPANVYHTGSPAVDQLQQTLCRNRARLSDWAGFDVRSPYLMVMQHPAGASEADEYRYMTMTLEACRRTGLKRIIVYPNCDTGYPGIVRAIEQERGYPDCYIFRHIPRELFLGLLQRCRALVGNSSCGIIEAGRLKVPVLNIGPRQQGRERGQQVLDCPYHAGKIAKTLSNILKNNRLGLKPCRIYGTGGSSRRIAVILARKKLTPELKHKLITY